MNITIDELRKLLHNGRFPLSSAHYDPQRAIENEMGPNALWPVEWLCQRMDRGRRIGLIRVIARRKERVA